MSLIGDVDIKTLTYQDGAWSSSPLLVSEFNTFEASVSPDSRWIAYTSNESGAAEIYVRPYPDIENGKWQISNDGGVTPRWNPNSRELFYSQGTDLVSVEFDSENGFSPNPPQVLITGLPVLTGNPPNYAVSSDGERFIQFESDEVTEPDAQPEKITLKVVENWFDELKDKTTTVQR